MMRQIAAKRLFSRSSRTVRSLSAWANYEMAPPDPIIGLNDAYRADDHPDKVIVGVGAYRDDLGKPYVLPCVAKAEEELLGIEMEYSGIVSDLFLFCRLKESLLSQPSYFSHY